MIVAPFIVSVQKLFRGTRDLDNSAIRGSLRELSPPAVRCSPSERLWFGTGGLGCVPTYVVAQLHCCRERDDESEHLSLRLQSLSHASQLKWGLRCRSTDASNGRLGA